MKNRINFFLKIERAPKKREWKLLICTNRSADFKPIVIHQFTKELNLVCTIEGFSNYLGLNKNKIEDTILFFYSFIKDKNNELQISKCKRYKLINLLSRIEKKNKRIDMGRIVLLLKNNKKDNNTQQQQQHYIIRNSITYSNGIILKKEFPLNKYIQRINEKLKKTFYIKPGEKWHIIYCDLDVFIDSPIITSVLMDNEQSNERFWINLYKQVKKIFEEGYGLKWDPKVNWVNLFTSINNFCHNYVYEKRDIYMESWFSRGFDCDESKMANQLCTLFNKCTFNLSKELELMQTYCKSQYIHFTDFCYVSAPSATMKFNKSNENMGHWVLLFILRQFFFDNWIDKEKRKGLIKKAGGLPLFLFGETTAPLYPSFIKPIQTKSVGDKKMRFLEGSKFYKRLNTLTTAEFLDEGIPGFYCGKRSGRVLRYGIPFKYLQNLRSRSNHNSKKMIVFVSFPKLGKKVLDFAMLCAEQRMPIPKLLMFKGEHYPCFVTNENINEKLKSIAKFFKENFNLDKKLYIHKYFIVYSLDDLMDKKKRKTLKENFGGKQISVDMYELMYKTYTFTIKIF